MPREWKNWQSRVVDDKFALGEYLGGSEHSAVFATVFDSANSSQRAAIKLLAMDPAQTAARLTLLSRIKTFSHPHLIRIFEAAECSLDGERLLYVVMEYAEENLADILPLRALTGGETREMLEPTLDAVAYIHAQGLVHGHIKPSNIMAVDDQLKISSDGIIAAGQVIDEPTVYLPTEAASGPLSEAADIWSLGITLAEALTQRKPGLEINASSFPAPLGTIVERCLRTDPRERATVVEIRNELNRSAASGLTPIARSTAAPPHKFPGAIAAVAILLLLAIIVIAGVSIGHRSGPTHSEEQAPVSPAPPAETKGGGDSAPTVSTTPGTVVRRVLPDVSNNALRTIHGTINVRIRVDVDAAGNVAQARLLAAGSSRFFANKAMEAARQWKFEAPLANGNRIPSQWNLEFQFRRISNKVREVQAVPGLTR